MEIEGGVSGDDRQLSALQAELDETHGQQIVRIKQQLQVRVSRHVTSSSTLGCSVLLAYDTFLTKKCFA